ncbi:uncharacterized protein (TIGR00290 family) [Pseudorhodoplanes sinuspersici]|nr:uncharacterized protein (TIGR00290 family) [Pseudorhodoplanes sinuspersici]
MTQRPKALMAWSSGKDSAWALHEIRKNGAYEIVGALTTVTDDFGRVSMHGVREDLLRAQLDAARLRSIVVRIPYPCPNDVYEQRMADVLAQAKSEGVTHVVFGDIFLADIRSYRETRLSAVGMTAVFPLWQRPTDQLARDMISAGVVAHLATIDLAKLPPSFAGRRFDSALLSELPPDVDPCGENGEFHSFVAAGPMFTHPIDVVTGETVVRDGFAYADLMRG